MATKNYKTHDTCRQGVGQATKKCGRNSTQSKSRSGRLTTKYDIMDDILDTNVSNDMIGGYCVRLVFRHGFSAGKWGIKGKYRG
jgi:hypothetical protein